MYERLSEEKRLELRKQYECLQEYMVSYNAISVVSERYCGISPEEIWHEALAIVDEISKSLLRQWKVGHVFDQLRNKYSLIRNEVGESVKVEEKEKEIIATLVLFDVVCMLSLAKKLKPEEAEQHPYYEHIKTILSYFRNSVLFNLMLEKLQYDEEQIEEITGHELQVSDYMDEIPQVTPKEKHQDLSDDKVRISRLKKVYSRLQQQLGNDFKGGSQWYYVYRLMADNKIYSDKSYVLFLSDLRKADVAEKHLPNTNTFSRKKEQIKSGTTYPNWKVTAGKKQATLDSGLYIAGIAFKIMFL